MSSAAWAIVAATNPANLSVSTWITLALAAGLLYLHAISTLSRRPHNAPCPSHTLLFRLMYGLFSTRVCELLLGYMLHTKRNEPQEEQLGGTKPVVIGSTDLRIKVVPILGAAFGGNYAYIVWDDDASRNPDRRAVVVDPADPYPVLRAAEAEGLTLDLLLTTHWHFDHAGGNATLRREVPGLQVAAAAAEKARVPAANLRLDDLQEVRVGALKVVAHLTPGHTLGSTVFEISNSEAEGGEGSIAFTGDTLFCGGCGRLFEGSAHQLHASLATLCQRLAPECRIFSGHEYTVMLLGMVVRTEPSNMLARKKLAWARGLRSQGQPTVPSTLAEEMQFNPYLRAGPADLALLCGCGDP